MRPDSEDDRMTLEDMEELPSMTVTERDRESPAFITVENEKGIIEHVQVMMMMMMMKGIIEHVQVMMMMMMMMMMMKGIIEHVQVGE